MTQLGEISARYLRSVPHLEAQVGAAVLAAGRPPASISAPYIASWTCPPDSEVQRLPNPWDDPLLVREAELLCWSTTGEILKAICPTLSGGDTMSGQRYWDCMLRPWLVHITSQALDAWVLVEAISVLSGSMMVRNLLPSPPNDFAESLALLQSAEGESRVKQLIAQCRGGVEIRNFSQVEEEESGQELEAKKLLSIAATLARRPKFALSVASERISHLTRSRDHTGHGTAMIGQTGFSRSDRAVLARRVPNVRWPSTPRCLPIFQIDPTLRRRLSSAVASSPLARAVLAILPEMIPRSLLEGIVTVKTQSIDAFGEASDVVIHAYGNQEHQNDFLARCALAGRSVTHAQHGGSYLQMDPNPQDRLEVSAGRRFAAWGAVAQDGVIPTATPRLERLRNTHVGGRKILFVEPLLPPVPQLIRFIGEPMGDQVFAMADQMAALVDGIGSLRARVELRRFPGTHAARRGHALDGLPVANRWLPAAWHMQRSMCSVVYFGTPMIEAMVIGVPTVVVLNPDHWHFRSDCRNIIDLLVEVGIVHHGPQSAAEHLTRHATSEFTDWWKADDTMAARNAFIHRFARQGDWLAEWALLLNDCRFLSETSSTRLGDH